MHENVKIALIVLTPFLVGGALLYFTRGNRKRQFSCCYPSFSLATCGSDSHMAGAPRILCGLALWCSGRLLRLSLPSEHPHKNDSVVHNAA